MSDWHIGLSHLVKIVLRVQKKHCTLKKIWADLFGSFRNNSYICTQIILKRIKDNDDRHLYLPKRLP